MNDFRIDDYFHLREFECPCCGAVRIEEELVEALHELRVARGRIVISTGGGYRCPAYQRAIHMARAEILKTTPKEPKVAAHTMGKAADVRLYSLDTGEAVPIVNDDILFLKNLGFNGIGIGKTGWAHLDVAHGTPAIWSYDY